MARTQEKSRSSRTVRRIVIRNLIVGDCHGHFKNLREFLISVGAINEDNQRINRDTLGVYCTGDLIDGGVNRMGDMLILEYVRDWFDKVIIGNHELPFLGGPRFMGLRSHDRELTRKLLQLEYEGKYVPAWCVDDYLLVHGGLAERWSFHNAQDAVDVITAYWQQSQEQTKEVPILDWIGSGRTASKWADETGGVFWLDWSEERNERFNQVVGHSTVVDGPVVSRNKKMGTEHWNVDVGGKFGIGLGGILIEQGQPTLPIFWGERYSYPIISKYSGFASADDEVGEGDIEDGEWVDIDTLDLDDPENFELYESLMKEC